MTHDFSRPKDKLAAARLSHPADVPTSEHPSSGRSNNSHPNSQPYRMHTRTTEGP
jgi:hypothetical protein